MLLTRLPGLNLEVQLQLVIPLDSYELIHNINLQWI